MGEGGTGGEQALARPLRFAFLRALLPLLLSSALPLLATAQAPDTLGVPVDSVLFEEVAADTVVVDTLGLLGDSLAAPVRRNDPVVSFERPEPGAATTLVPTRRPVFTVAPLVADRTGAFYYDLGVPGAPSGVGFDGMAPRRAALTLGGIPAEDPFTGRPAWELLPTEPLAGLRAAPGLFGEPAGFAADLRAFAAAEAVTELRYRTGPNGIQFVGATHGQTRRPAFARNLGGDQARLGVLFHVSGRGAGGEYANAEIGGWQLVGRVGLALPALSIEVTERHVRADDGAWGGVAPTDPPVLAFDRNAAVANPGARRVTIRNDLSATARLPLLTRERPLTVTGFWTAATLRATGFAVDTTEAKGGRYGIRAEQEMLAGGHRLRAQLHLWADTRARAGPGDASGRIAFPDSLESVATEVHAAVADSFSVAGFGVAAEGGVHAGPGFAFPTARFGVRRTLGRLTLGATVQAAGARRSTVERVGFGTLLAAPDSLSTERTLRAEATARVRLGPLGLRLRGAFVRQTDATVLLLEPEGARFATAAEPLQRVVATLGVGFREEARRGLYAEATAHVYAFLNADSTGISGREAAATPDVWGSARLGARARDLFDDALDLDLYVRGRAWTAFRSRALHAPTALFGLPSAIEPEVSASGTLDAILEAGLGRGRATAFVAYENVLAGRAYTGAYVVPVYPLSAPRLRLGLFWVLPF